MSNTNLESPYKNLPLVVRDASKNPGTVAAKVTELSTIINVPGVGLVWRVRVNFVYDFRLAALACFDVDSLTASIGTHGLIFSGRIVMLPSKDDVFFVGGQAEAKKAIRRYEEEHGAKIVQRPVELSRGLPALFEQFFRRRAWSR